MALLLSEGRDAELKEGWTKGSLYSISAPPLQLLAIVGIVVFLLFVSSYLNYKAAMQTATINGHLPLLLLPLVLLLIAIYGRHLVPAQNVQVKQSFGEDGVSSSPWGLAALLTLVLVLVYYRPHLILVVAIVFFYIYILSI